MASGNSPIGRYEEWPPWFPYLYCTKVKIEHLGPTARKIYAVCHNYFLEHGKPLSINGASRDTGIHLRKTVKVFRRLTRHGLMDEARYGKMTLYIPIEAALIRGWKNCSTSIDLGGYRG